MFQTYIENQKFILCSRCFVLRSKRRELRRKNRKS